MRNTLGAGDEGFARRPEWFTGAWAILESNVLTTLQVQGSKRRCARRSHERPLSEAGAIASEGGDAMPIATNIGHQLVSELLV
jgi:hypothetical protein